MGARGVASRSAVGPILRRVISPERSTRTAKPLDSPDGSLTMAPILRLLPLALAPVRRRRLRSAFTVGAIAFAFLLFSILFALRSALSFGLAFADEARLRVANRISIIETLPARYRREIQQVGNVAAVSGNTWFGGMYREPRNFFLSIAVTPSDFLDLHPGVVLEGGVADRWVRQLDGAVAGRPLLERFGWTTGDRISLEAPVHPRRDGTRTWSFILVGDYAVADDAYPDSQFLLRQDYLDGARAEPSGVSWFTVRLADRAGAAETADAIDEVFRNSAAPTRTQPEGAAAATFARQFADFGSAFAAILAVVFGITALVATSTVMESVRERSREFAVLQALGYSPEQVTALVLGESAAILGPGAVVGLSGGAFAVAFAGESLAALFPSFAFRPRDALVGLAIAAVLALLAAIPAIVRLRSGNFTSLTAE